jgi:hypothetical protein
VKSAKVLGFDRESKFYFNLAVSEDKVVLPSTIRKMLEELKKESKGDEDYPYNSMVMTAITGSVEKSGDKWTFKARGSGQLFELVPNADVQKLVDAGKTLLTVVGKVTDEPSLRLEISSAKDPAN